MAATLRSPALVALIAGLAFGQAPTPRPAFEVATVRMYPHDNPFRPEAQGFAMSPDGVRATHVALRGCLQWAYDIVDVSGPAWIIEESYDIVAKAKGPVSAGEIQQMFRTLLEDRFKLKFHRATKSSPITALMAAKNGIKNLPTGDSTLPMEIKRLDGKLELRNAPMSRIAGVLGSPFGNMPLEKVVDETGLNGVYDVTLDLKNFDPKEPEFEGRYQEMRDALVRFVSAALEKQYGLKLERRNAQVETLVVDEGNKVPTEN